MEPEGYYHPECFVKTTKAMRIAVLHKIEEYAFNTLSKDFVTFINTVRSAFTDDVVKQELTNSEIAIAILRGLLRAWGRLK